MEDDGLVGQQALRAQRRELRPRGERIPRAPLPVSHAFGEVNQPRVQLSVPHPREQPAERGSGQARDGLDARGDPARGAESRRRLDVADQGLVGDWIGRTFDRGLATQERADLGVLHHLGQQPQACRVRQQRLRRFDETAQLGRTVAHHVIPLVPVRIWLGPQRPTEQRLDLGGGRGPEAVDVVCRMIVKVDEPREDVGPGTQVNDHGARRRGRRMPAAPGRDDGVAANEHAAVPQHGAIRIHGHHRSADEDAVVDGLLDEPGMGVRRAENEGGNEQKGPGSCGGGLRSESCSCGDQSGSHGRSPHGYRVDGPWQHEHGRTRASPGQRSPWGRP